MTRANETIELKLSEEYRGGTKNYEDVMKYHKKIIINMNQNVIINIIMKLLLKGDQH